MSRPNRLFSRWMPIGIGLGFLAIIAAAISAVWVVSDLQQHSRLVDHTHQVERNLLAFQGQFERAETARRGFLLSGAPAMEATYRASAANARAILGRVGRLVGDNPAQQQRLGQLRALVLDHLTELDRSIVAMRRGDGDAARSDFRRNAAAGEVPAIRTLVGEMIGAEARLLAQRSAGQARTVQQLYVILILAGLLILPVAIASFWIIRRHTRELGRSHDLLRELNASLEDKVVERTVDLRRANEEIQRFAYIVSHDLRSPLVNVMGFTSELETAGETLAEFIDQADDGAPPPVSEEVRRAAREDLPEAIRFIRSSTEKMDRLINAILQLSRQGRRELRPVPIDMRALVLGIGETLEHRLADTGATLDVQAALPEIVSDRLAVEQVFSNLIENAVKYLRLGYPGRIWVRGARHGTHVVFEVEDNGRGIDPKDHERIFDLFRRSGAQDQPGEGIGLAHVRALVHRLGGTISCQSALDEGSMFSVSLPVIFREQERATA